MNQKDYKEIAEIINKRFALVKESKYQSVVGVVVAEYRGLIEDFADYFERENIKEQSFKVVFDRKQFEKWCGVKE